METNPMVQPPTVVEFSATMTSEEIKLLRAAITRSAREQDWKPAAINLFASLRARASRYQVRELGRGNHNATV
jgi:hypothetical protein